MTCRVIRTSDITLHVVRKITTYGLVTIIIQRYEMVEEELSCKQEDKLLCVECVRQWHASARITEDKRSVGICLSSHFTITTSH